MKKIFAAVMTMLFVMAVFTSCGGDVTLDTAVAADALRNNITYEDELNVLDAAMMSSIYTDLDAADVVSSKIYTSSTATTEEIAVFEAKDAEAAGRIEAAMNKRIASQKELYASYAPGEVERLEGAVLVKKGNYVVFCVAGDAAAAEKEVNALF